MKSSRIRLARAQGCALVLLATAARKQAFVLAYIVGFMVLGFGVVIALALILLLRAAPEESILKARLCNSNPK